MLALVLSVLIARDIAKVENKPFRVELGRLVSASLIVFFSVYLAQYVSNTTQKNRENQHIINLLHATKIQVDSFNDFLLSAPESYEKAQQYMSSSYKPLSFFQNNPMAMPKIVETVLSDTSILRIMHPQFMTSIFNELENANKALATLNSADIKVGELRPSINKASLFLVNVSKYLDYEIRFQKKVINEQGLFELHRELIKSMNEKPVNSLVELNN
ncbi:hypothetical protein [Vibrio parahaemolyticus]|uniref:hypothetical protein n=1 Tax=Vibrio parahaemolyticus TaxID=670 RepID=UPI0008FC7F67